ncbi:MAG TPA: hypothetical protein VIM75_18290 [Ohtaekwangia sp.]|uniref:hypothetical protein n=1 Tax=Ohtaekwangia sp. TaxID=2066019 RepID=UPI002F926144
MIVLDFETPGQVSSPQTLTVVTSEPGVTLHIFTGIAMTSMYNSDEHILFWKNSRTRDELIQVTVGRVSGQMIASAAQVSLARIWAYEGLFNFHLSTVWVEQGAGGEIILKSNASMNGDAGLVAVSYQVNVKIIEVETEIRGIVRWNAAGIQAIREIDLVDVGARRSGESTPSILGTVEGPPLMMGEFMQVRFLIRRPPLGIPLTIVAEAREGAFVVGGVPSSSIASRQVAGGNPVTLTVSEPRRTDFIFELYEVG